MKIILRTERLILYEFTDSDASMMFELNSDPDVLRFTGDRPFKSIKEAKEFIASYTNYKVDGYGRWSVKLKTSGEYIGWCGLNLDHETNETDLGFRFMRQHWNQGYAYESARACIDLAVQHLHLHMLVGRAHQENTASIRVLEKSGMQFDSIFTREDSLWHKYTYSSAYEK